jgi:hypothetical protein
VRGLRVLRGSAPTAEGVGRAAARVYTLARDRKNQLVGGAGLGVNREKPVEGESTTNFEAVLGLDYANFAYDFPNTDIQVSALGYLGLNQWGRFRLEAGRKLWDELRALAEHAVPAAERTARVELDPPHTALLRPENEFKPEVALTWRIFHPDLTPVTAEDRESLAGLAKRLAALGLKRGRW